VFVHFKDNFFWSKILFKIGRMRLKFSNKQFTVTKSDVAKEVLIKTDVFIYIYIRRAQVKVGLINLCKGLFSLNARIYYKLKSCT
jgi:hypothetical protein